MDTDDRNLIGEERDREPAVNFSAGPGSAELLLLPDGRILAHNITPALAALLAELAPGDEAMRLRASACSPVPPPPAPVIRSALLPRP